MPITIGSKTESDYSNPLGLLSDCHRRIERFLNALILITNRARGGELDKDQRNALEVGLRYFREVAPKHTLDEEESLFPRMHACGDARARSAIALLDALRADHVVVEAEHTVIDALGKRWLSRGVLPAQAVERLAQLLDQLNLTYQRHIAIEDQEVFPVARQILDRAELTNVGLEMAMRRSINLTALESHLRILAPRNRHDLIISTSR